MQNGDLRIISDDYYVVKAQHTNRALHRHEGYEAFYIISGECDHVLVCSNTEKNTTVKQWQFYHTGQHCFSQIQKRKY